MKKELALFGLFSFFALFSAPPVIAADVEITVDEAVSSEPDDGKSTWRCRAQAPRLIRVYSAKGTGYRDDIQDQALAACNEDSTFQCWPLGCVKLR